MSGLLDALFFPSLGSSKRVKYEVEINAKTGSFGLVKQIE